MNNMHRSLLAAALLALASMSASAQQSGDFYEALGNPSAGGNTIDVEVNKGSAIRLNAAASSVAVADPAIADVQVLSPRMLYINGRGVGETSVIAVDGADNVIFESTINVTHNLSRLQRAAIDMSPDSKISASSTDNAIILKGTAESPVMAEKMQRMATSFLQGDNQRVINMIDTSASDQVMLKVRVVELARTELKRFGINWESVLASGNFLFGLGQGRDFIGNTVNAAGAANSFDRNTASGDNTIFGGFRDDAMSVNAAIDALEENGLVSVLAEPNLTTRSGMPASFLAGGEIPIPVPGEDGTVTIEYREFGVSLQFTPVVLSKDKISLTVLPEVSSLSDANAITAGEFGTIPSIQTRRASTTVDLGSGQTFAIAGLLRSDQGNNVSKFPILGDLPILGTLFRSTEFSNGQTELVILVTPYIARPIDKPELAATPLDGYTPPTDAERILLGRVNGEGHPEQPGSVKREPSGTTSYFEGIGGQAGFLMR